MDLFDKCRAFTSAREAMTAGIYPYFAPFENSDATTARLDGREIVMAGSNNYLGLTKDPRVLDAARAALQESGTSCTGSRLLNGNLRLHEELEAELADLLGKPAALVFSTGYGANVGTISALMTRGDTVVLDREAHASAIDGAQMTLGRVRFFAHNDVDDLRRKLVLAGRDGGGVLVVVDGVYSMGGDVCPLPEIVAACRQHGATLLVDDAHGVGVLGQGRGTCAQLGLTDEVDLITITFSKSFASIGGAVLGDADVIHYLRHHARAEIFSASLSPANTAAALAAVRVARAEPWRGRRAMENAAYVAAALADLGLPVGTSDSPIIPVHTGEALRTAFLWRRLMDLGVYTNAVLPPAASPRLRASFMATHTRDHLDRVVAAFRTMAGEGLVDGRTGTAA
ncbi:aminotransferase class I/II-fold pyridoxal phosphate-dependent enzyme [Intrasporangium sp.]|uniref:aminotransferase class I/II-fold pyridoxal phosphate-dependent enzyme n=1 Tax=Intrasporangium sp. TaxID=1925024 RepID=UPI003221C1D3